MLFGLYLMFELFLLIGYFAYSYDHITGYTRVRKHPREMHPAEYLIGITIFTFLSIDLNGQIMLSVPLSDFHANTSRGTLSAIRKTARRAETIRFPILLLFFISFVPPRYCT